MAKQGAHNLAKTHCRNGHPYAGANLAVHNVGPYRARKCKTCARNNTLKHSYGISRDDYNSMLSVVPGCAICGAPPGNGNGPLQVDHDHKTGRVRGLLCMGCNTSIGKLRDGELFAAASDYLSLAKS